MVDQECCTGVPVVKVQISLRPSFPYFFNGAVNLRQYIYYYYNNYVIIIIVNNYSSSIVSYNDNNDNDEDYGHKHNQLNSEAGTAVSNL